MFSTHTRIVLLTVIYDLDFFKFWCVSKRDLKGITPDSAQRLLWRERFGQYRHRTVMSGDDAGRTRVDIPGTCRCASACGGLIRLPFGGDKPSDHENRHSYDCSNP